MFPYTYDRLTKLSKKENDKINAEESAIWHYIKNSLNKTIAVFVYLDIVDTHKVLYVLKTNNDRYRKDYLNDVLNEIKSVIPLEFETIVMKECTYLKCSDYSAINRLLALLELKGIK